MMTHTEKMRVNWVDTDASGRIHNTAALRYFEITEHSLMRKLFGGQSTPGARAFGLPRVHVECDYRASLGYPDEFECTARIERVGRSSVTYGFRATRLADGEICLEGRVVAAAVGPDGRSAPLPESFRAVLEAAQAEADDAMGMVETTESEGAK
ncbi:MAG: acyl-CoA thioesterase [Myxococcota bacterium]